MPRGQHLHLVRPPREKRLAALGREGLEPGEVSERIRVRLPRAQFERFAALSPKARGEVILAGFRALEEARHDE
ncbi:MAG: hypothetical protein NZN28_07710 [Meiothermus sp.]|uniref:hypothetical protein n=1 Tax=Meiothermus sp. TaxID=1955249 RepID=UPI0025E761A2|nr:hypothetical protein [Meiothermus sp.]MCS7068500.1 hypothetical protein [Meiothermus sp.]